MIFQQACEYSRHAFLNFVYMTLHRQKSSILQVHVISVPATDVSRMILNLKYKVSHLMSMTAPRTISSTRVFQVQCDFVTFISLFH